jgi:group I intron endonuclease
MPYGWIYLARNKVNGKSYVGQTTQQPERRFAQHRLRLGNSHCKAFGAALKCHGYDAFEFSIIGESADKATLDEAEIAAITLYDCLAPCGYNLKTGGAFGKHSAQTKRKMSLARQGKRLPPTQIEKIRLRMLGTSPSLEARAKIAAALRGRPMLEANKAALRAANLGRVPSMESCQKMSRNRSGIPVSEAKKEKLRIANLGKRHSTETRAKMSASQRAQWAARKTPVLELR